MKGYSLEKVPEKSAIARVVEANISMKDAVNVAHFLKGKPLEAAKDYVQGVIDKKKAIPYFRYLDSVSHRKGMGPGRYPERAARAFLELLNNVSANAEFKNYDPEKLVIEHIAASKGRMLKRFRPKAYGTAGAFNKDLVNLEVVVKEVPE